jgi:hypothetical protein
VISIKTTDMTMVTRKEIVARAINGKIKIVSVIQRTAIQGDKLKEPTKTARANTKKATAMMILTAKAVRVSLTTEKASLTKEKANQETALTLKVTQATAAIHSPAHGPDQTMRVGTNE